MDLLVDGVGVELIHKKQFDYNLGKVGSGMKMSLLYQA